MQVGVQEVQVVEVEEHCCVHVVHVEQQVVVERVDGEFNFHMVHKVKLQHSLSRYQSFAKSDTT